MFFGCLFMHDLNRISQKKKNIARTQQLPDFQVFPQLSASLPPSQCICMAANPSGSDRGSELDGQITLGAPASVEGVLMSQSGSPTVIFQSTIACQQNGPNIHGISWANKMMFDVTNIHDDSSTNLDPKSDTKCHSHVYFNCHKLHAWPHKYGFHLEHCNAWVLATLYSSLISLRLQSPCPTQPWTLWIWWLPRLLKNILSAHRGFE